MPLRGFLITEDREETINHPDPRISLCVYADGTGLRYWNDDKDPMPIKTINMAGLQKWEETDDYIIYVDKDAVMTTVQQYVTGTYDLFLERKANVDGALELLRENGIVWTAEDDSKLLQDINLVQLERIANTPTTMDEPTEIQTFETRTVPTTYECCFRTDKKTGEIYIGEGYENLFSSARNWGGNVVNVVETTGNATEGWYKTKWLATSRTDRYNAFITNNVACNAGDVISFNFKCDTICKVNKVGHTVGGNDGQLSTDLTKIVANINSTNRHPTLRYDEVYFEQNWSETVYNICITKTSTPKPFVKSVMPSGKLSFVTNATHYSHSFIGKGLEFTGNSPTFYRCAAQPNASAHEYIKPNPEAHSIAIVSTYANLSSKNGTDWLNSTGGNFGLSTGYVSLSGVNYTYDATFFKQLLIYKGNLTEAELKAENEKNIKLRR